MITLPMWKCSMAGSGSSGARRLSKSTRSMNASSCTAKTWIGAVAFAKQVGGWYFTPGPGAALRCGKFQRRTRPILRRDAASQSSVLEEAPRDAANRYYLPGILVIHHLIRVIAHSAACLVSVERRAESVSKIKRSWRLMAWLTGAWRPIFDGR